MKAHLRASSAAAAVLFLLAPCWAGRSPEGLQVGTVQYFPIGDSPYSGPVEAIVNTNHLTAARGTLTDVFLVVQNHSNTATVTVNLDLDLRYADGVRVQPFDLGQLRTYTLGPDQGVGFYVFFVVPNTAPLGTARFRMNALVGRLSGGETRSENPMVATDSVEFEVVP